MKFSVVLAVAFVLAACSRDPGLPNFGVVPDFRLTSQTGQPFLSKEKLDGRVWVANFIFTNCMGPCPRMSGQMKEVRDAVENLNVRFVSFTVDPERDTPEVLAEYSKRWRANPAQWFFLTGTQRDLHKLSREVFMLGDIDSKLQHSTRFALIDRKSRIRGFYDTSDKESLPTLISDVKQLSRDLR